MYILAHKTGSKEGKLEFSTGESSVQPDAIRVCCDAKPSLEALATSVHKLSRRTVMKNNKLDESTFIHQLGAFKQAYLQYFGKVCENQGMFPKLLEQYYYDIKHTPSLKGPEQPQQLSPEGCTDMFRSLVHAWTSAPLDFVEDDEDIIDNAGAGKCGYIAVMLSLLLNGRDAFNTMVAKMYALIQQTINAKDLHARSNKLTEQTKKLDTLNAQVKALQETQTLLSQKASDAYNEYQQANQQLAKLNEQQTQCATNMNTQKTALAYALTNTNDKLAITAQTNIGELNSQTAALKEQVDALQSTIKALRKEADQTSRNIHTHIIQTQKPTKEATTLQQQVDQERKQLEVDNELVQNLNTAFVFIRLVSMESYTDELLRCYKRTGQRFTHNFPSLCVYLLMVLLYRDEVAVLKVLATMVSKKIQVAQTSREQIVVDNTALAKTTWPQRELSLEEYEQMCNDLGICGAIIIPDAKKRINQVLLYPSNLVDWQERYDKSQTYVWLESKGRISNGGFVGGHYVTHDYRDRIERFGILVDAFNKTTTKR